MVRIAKSLIVSALVLGVAAVPASAQIKWQAGLGLTMPNGDFGDAFKMGFHGMGAATFPLTNAPVSIRADLGYHINSADSDFDVSSNILTLSGDAVYTFKGTGAAKWYALGGLTWGRASLGGDDAPDVDADTDFGINLGGGANFALGGTQVFAEARYFTVGDADFIPITFGIRF
jgi:outer membrane protein with beta-barrel domain